MRIAERAGFGERRTVTVIPASIEGADRGFLKRLIARAGSDDRVTALFLGGSHASGNADAYSDLDLYLITTDAGYDGVLAERKEILRSVGDIVFLEEHSDFGFLLLLYIFADGVHGEIALAPARALDDVHSGPHKVLVDKERLIRDHVFPTGGLEDLTRRELVRKSLVWFWYDRSLLHTALRRGNLWTAHFYLERCRERCLDLAWLRSHPHNWPGGHEKAEVVLDSEMLEQLASTMARLQGGDITRAATQVTNFFEEVGAEVAEDVGVDYPKRLAETVRARLTGG
jgi:predicted nucleotidyltransferase